MNLKEKFLRKKIIEACLAIEKKKLNQGKTGNISNRWKNGILITPSGIDYDKLKYTDIVFINHKEKVEGGGEPSTEWRFHLNIIKARKEINSIVHNHPIYGTGFSMLRKEIKSFHYLIGLFGGNNIRCAKFKMPGTAQLSKEVLSSLKDRKACLIANHGTITLGQNLNEALYLAEQFEALCKQITIANINGKPKFIDDKKMKLIIKKLKNYNKE